MTLLDQCLAKQRRWKSPVLEEMIEKTVCGIAFTPAFIPYSIFPTRMSDDLIVRDPQCRGAHLPVSRRDGYLLGFDHRRLCFSMRRNPRIGQGEPWKLLKGRGRRMGTQHRFVIVGGFGGLFADPCLDAGSSSMKRVSWLTAR